MQSPHLSIRGAFGPRVDRVYQLTESAEAQLRAAEGHVRGKLVIHVGAATPSLGPS